MNDPNRLTKWLFVIGLVVLALIILYPPGQKLKGGIDLVGGTSLLFEIDTTGLSPADQRGLSERVMRVLRERVDPKGQLNLEWRPVGNTRLEVRMPRPPREALGRRERYEDVLNAIEEKNLARFEVEAALNAAAGEREALLEALVRGVDERRPLVEELARTFDEYKSAQASGEAAAVESASEAYESAMRALLDTNFPLPRFEDVLALGQGDQRQAQLEKLRTEYPSFDAGSAESPGGKLITKAVAAYEVWSRYKADLEDPSDLKRLLRGAGVLEFRILARRDPSTPSRTQDDDPRFAQEIQQYVDRLKEVGPRPQAGAPFVWLPLKDPLSFLRLDSLDELEAQKTNPNLPIVEDYMGNYYVLAYNDAEHTMLKGTGRDVWSLQEAYPSQDPMSGWIVAFRLDPRGGQRFGELTGNNLNGWLCIVLDGEAMSFANIESRITEQGIIRGDFTQERVQELVRILEAGSLPARLKETPLMENTIGPSLGETNRVKGIRGAVIGTALVAIFILFYYGLVAGGMADIALALNLLFVLAVMALLQATFTLPGIAGLILTVGMAIDANVLIFERIREETERGVVFRRALNAGYDKAFSTILDANITTLITCVILGFVGSQEVKGFAIVLGIGICTSMFTALFVTRLVFNTLIAKGWLKELHMRKLVGVPTIDWLALRRIFWPVSISVVIVGLALFIGLSTTRAQRVFDIEFIGGTSLQVDLKPGIQHTDEEMMRIVTGSAGVEASAAGWLRQAATALRAAETSLGDAPGTFALESPTLTGEQMAAMVRAVGEGRFARDGISATGHEARFIGRPGEMDLSRFQAVVAEAADYAAAAALRLQNARVQSVGDRDVSTGLSYEIVTTETQRELVQEAVLAMLADELVVQRALVYTVEEDEEFTREPYFVVEQSDRYLSDVIGGDANFDIRRFRGGAAVVVQLDPQETPITVEEFEKRLREVGLQPEFEQYRTRDSAIFPLDEPVASDGSNAYRRFAVLAVDEGLLYMENEVQWAELLASKHLEQVEAALGQEKSLSKVVQFAPQIATQTQNRATFAIVLALAAIVAYLWLRFGTKEYGLAACVALVHDVSVMLGMLAVSHFLYNTIVGKALMLDPFQIDLPMIAAILTVIGYSLNDTIVIFDRIRENKGRTESLNPNLINSSINQCMSRTILTSMTTLLVVLVLYVAGGKGVHGFSFALIIGVITGTYSTVAVATPLLHRPRILHVVVTLIVALAAIGIIYELTPGFEAARWVLIALAAAATAYMLFRIQRETAYGAAGGAVGA